MSEWLNGTCQLLCSAAHAAATARSLARSSASRSALRWSVPPAAWDVPGITVCVGRIRTPRKFTPRKFAQIPSICRGVTGGRREEAKSKVRKTRQLMRTFESCQQLITHAGQRWRL